MWWWTIVAWAGSMTFDEALDQALEQNLELASQRLGNEVVRYRLVRARGGFDPQFSGGLSVDRSKTPSNQATDVGGAAAVVTSSSTSWDAGLSQALPTGGSLSASISESQTVTDSTNALSSRFVSAGVGVGLTQPLLRGVGLGEVAELRDAQLAVAIQEQQWRQQLETLVLSVSEAYWGLVSARERLAIAERGVELAQQQLDDTRERLDEGFAGSGDVLQVQVSLGQAQRSLVSASAGVGSAEDRLSRLLGLPRTDGPSLELTDDPAVPERLPEGDALLAQAQERNARLALARLVLEQARRTARRGKNAALPNLTLSADASLSAGGVDVAAVRTDLWANPAPSYGARLSVGLPLVPRQALADHGTAKLGLEQAELAFAAAEADVELQVAEAVRDLDRNQAALANAGDTRRFAEQSLAAQKELLGEGRGSTRDVVDALEDLRGAEATELEARIQLQLALLRAEQAAGVLVD